MLTRGARFHFRHRPITHRSSRLISKSAPRLAIHPARTASDRTARASPPRSPASRLARSGRRFSRSSSDAVPPASRSRPAGSDFLTLKSPGAGHPSLRAESAAAPARQANPPPRRAVASSSATNPPRTHEIDPRRRANAPFNRAFPPSSATFARRKHQRNAEPAWGDDKRRSGERIPPGWTPAAGSHANPHPAARDRNHRPRATAHPTKVDTPPKPHLSRPTIPGYLLPDPTRESQRSQCSVGYEVEGAHLTRSPGTSPTSSQSHCWMNSRRVPQNASQPSIWRF